jgi:uncharacterized RmlC-like cupin family protein
MNTVSIIRAHPAAFPAYAQPNPTAYATAQLPHQLYNAADAAVACVNAADKPASATPGLSLDRGKLLALGV